MIDFRVYLITNRKIIKGDYYESIKEALEGGVRAVQLREKDLPVRELLDRAYRLREITRKYNTRLFINDRVDVAVAVDADGVHLGGASMPVHAVRKIVKDRLLIGVSTHSVEEASEAEKGGADFITFGPVYETPSKMKYGPPQDLDRLREVTEKTTIPVFAIGGIDEKRIEEVKGAGVFGVAMISAILLSENIKQTTERIERLIR